MCVCKNGVLVENAYFPEQMKKLRNLTKINTTIFVYERECLIRSADRNDYSKTTFMIVNRLPKISENSKIVEFDPF